MKSECADCKQEKFIIARGLCSVCLLKATVSKGEARRVETFIEQSQGKTPAATPLKEKTYPCDGCGKEFKKATDLQKFPPPPNNKLLLCAPCHAKETAAAVELAASTTPLEFDPANFKTWPTCSKCYAHIKTPLEDGICTNCRSKQKPVAIFAVQPTDSNKYQAFFNQETQAITELLAEQGEESGIQTLRQFIIDGAADLLSKEAELLEVRTKQQARTIKFNALLSKLSLDEQAKLRIEDGKYTPKSGEPRKLKSPLAAKEKEKKIKKSLDDQINAMFGGVLSAEEIQQKKKALGM